MATTSKRKPKAKKKSAAAPRTTSTKRKPPKTAKGKASLPAGKRKPKSWPAKTVSKTRASAKPSAKPKPRAKPKSPKRSASTGRKAKPKAFVKAKPSTSRKRASTSKPSPKRGASKRASSGNVTPVSRKPRKTASAPAKPSAKRKAPSTYAEGRKRHKRPKRKYHDATWQSKEGSKTKGSHRDFIGRLRVSRPVGKRPHISLIRFWVSKRSNVEFWKERDGSYHAIASFRGEHAWEYLERAFESLPLPGYIGLRYFIRKPLNDLGKAGSAPTVIKSKNGEPMALIPHATGTYVASADGFGLARTEVFKGDPDLYERRFGLAVVWPNKLPKGATE